MGIPFYSAVEPQDAADDERVIGPLGRVIVMDKDDQGISYVRNFIWEHSNGLGAVRHWQLDDDIDSFMRLNRNTKIVVASGTIFRISEMFAERFENVGQAGFQYASMIPRKRGHRYPPLYMNSRVYSTTLNYNDVPYRYRTPLNEDTDMSLQFLKGGWCTINFNCFLAEMAETMKQEGGQTDLYLGDDEGDNPKRIAMARKLVELHPDVTRIHWRWGRWQHLVDYRKFKLVQLRPKPGVYESIPVGFDDHGMVLEHYVDGEWRRGESLDITERGQ